MEIILLAAENKTLEQKGDIIQVGNDGEFSTKKWSEKMKQKFILVLNFGTIKNKKLEESAYEEIENNGEIIKNIKFKRNFNIDLKDTNILIDSQNRRYINESDFKKLKIKNKDKDIVVTDPITPVTLKEFQVG
ncbi:MAG: hypothetical protein JXB50_02285 [Spirochaetes bacterium]|nr:hypothetical protein [Spirochaetota bacterium]